MRGTGHCLPPGRAGALRRCRPAGRALAPDGRQDRRGAVRLPPRAHSGCTGAQAAQDQILRGAGRRQGCGAGVLYYGVETGGWVPGQGRDKPRRGQRGRRGAGAGRCAAAGHAACWCCRGPGVDPRAKVHVGAPRHDGGRPEQHVERRQAAGRLARPSSQGACGSDRAPWRRLCRRRRPRHHPPPAVAARGGHRLRARPGAAPRD
mmetsp:Transcript_17584/g.55536  ORF Transcript_17584/g.55536 Transcript_17584/m.55536 type:complete len:205 (+) Transcript_17584:735-1349(+)